MEEIKRKQVRLPQPSSACPRSNCPLWMGGTWLCNRLLLPFKMSRISWMFIKLRKYCILFSNFPIVRNRSIDYNRVLNIYVKKVVQFYFENCRTIFAGSLKHQSPVSRGTAPDLNLMRVSHFLFEALENLPFIETFKALCEII